MKMAAAALGGIGGDQRAASAKELAERRKQSRLLKQAKINGVKKAWWRRRK